MTDLIKVSLLLRTCQSFFFSVLLWNVSSHTFSFDASITESENELNSDDIDLRQSSLVQNASL